jgi:hypothetical protein
MQYTDGKGNRNGTVYHDPVPRMAGGDQVFWNFSNPDAAAFVRSSYVGSLNGTDVDGTCVSGSV